MKSQYNKLRTLQHQIDVLQKEVNQLTKNNPTSRYINDGD